MPANFFDTGQSICPSKRFLDMECLGCGSTRAIQHLIHLDFQKAWEYNKLSFFTFILIAYFWLSFVSRVIKKIKNSD